MILFLMISTARSEAYTEPALRSLLARTVFAPDDRILVIDNDGGLTLPLTTPHLELFRNPRPLGYAANVNQALRAADALGADLVVLNNDLIFTTGWLPPLLDGDAAILLPMSNRDIRYTIGSWELGPFLDLAAYQGHEAALEAVAASHRATVPGRVALQPPVFSFHAFRLPMPVYRRLGGFDESFGPAGGEDGDYQIRAYLAGFDVRYAVESFILHFGGRSTWNSAETANERCDRETAYTTRFRAKWGADLAELFAFGIHRDAVIRREDLQSLIDAHDLKRVIEHCLARRRD